MQQQMYHALDVAGGAVAAGDMSFWDGLGNAFNQGLSGGLNNLISGFAPSEPEKVPDATHAPADNTLSEPTPAEDKIFGIPKTYAIVGGVAVAAVALFVVLKD